MRKLIDKLNYYTRCYDEGHPEISDKAWDDMYFQLLDLEKELGVIYPDSPTQKINYEVVSELPKVEHNHKMLSLDKTKDIQEINNFLGNYDYLAMAKMDGLTCSLKYLNGELVSAETRGNGFIGENIIHNARVISSIPKNINYMDELIVDGEIICLKQDFIEFSKDYKNPRNFAAGSIRLLDAKECAHRKLTFIAWDLIKGFNYEDSFSKRLDILNTLGFQVVPWVKENPEYAINDLKDYCNNHGYPIDGIVFKFDSVSYGLSLGETSHHFKNAIAYKFYDEEYDTKLIDIEWSMGKTGVLTPIALFEPIDIDGSIITRASLHNINIMNDILGHNPHKGQPIWVTKKNMIIPQVVKADKKSEGVLYYYEHPICEIPKFCPICGQPTIEKTSETGTMELYCSNPNCEGKLINQLEHYLGKKGLDAKGISEATLEKLIDWGWVFKIEDIYNLSQFKEEWIKKLGFGEKSVSKILQAIEDSKNTTLDKFICAISIPLIGNAMAKTIAAYFQTWNNFREAVENHFDFTQLNDFGEITNESIINFDFTIADKLFTYLTISPYSVEKNTSTKLNNIKVCITGSLHHFKNRGELQKLIEQNGGKVVSSVTKNTNILINNDITSTSSKNISAKNLNIPIITEEQFIAEYID